MGGNSSKESRAPAQAEPRPTNRLRHGNSRSAGQDDPSSQSASDRLHSVYNSRQARNSRPDLSFLGIGGGVERDPSQPEARKETKAEREARRLERERVAREKERERSMKEEGVDGGYLVTLGTYTGPEDFSKPTVRQLMIERRLAPFWRGLNDHSESWTENQLVAVVRELPLPAPDEKPPDSDRPASGVDSMNPQTSATNLNSLTVPISSRSPSYTSETSQHLSPAHPAFSLPNSSPFGSPPSSSPFFRGRAKTLAALTSRNNSQADMTPQEIQLPKDPYVNRQAIEAFLYKDAAECPICFLYYPPYLNRTRCCDQPICSECFVQIKRPDPHPPEHHGDENGAPAPSSSTENPMADGANLISEPAACPYCVVPEFGVTYEPPPFRRGLAYQGQNPLASPTSAMSSSSSLNSQGLGSNVNRRRTTSISASAATVITTDRIRPDWAKKLSDARAHALRRAAAATALHNAAYVLGNAGGSDSRGLPFGRRRRTMLFGDSPSSSGNHTLQVPEQLSLGNVGALLAAAERQGAGSGPTAPQGDLFPGRQSSRRSRMEDLEELMMMEAIRQSIAAEEERKKKEEKEAAKESKKEEKKKSKEAKKAEKAARKSMIYPAGINASSSSQIPVAGPSTVEWKGKAVDRSGLEGGARPDEDGPSSSLGGGLEHGGMAGVPPHRQALRQLSNVSSSASSVNESVPTSGTPLNRSPNQSGVNLASSNEKPLRSDPPTLPEPLLNFRSLAEVIEFEDTSLSEHDSRHTANSVGQTEPANSNRDRTDSGESSSTAPPPPAGNVDGARGVGVSHDASEPIKGPGDGAPVEFGDGEIEAVPVPQSSTMDILGKQLDVNIMDRGRHNGVTQ